MNLENIKKPKLVKDLNFLKVNNLSVFYKRKKILNDINLLLKEGEVVSIAINTEDGMPLSVDMPAHVILEVTATEPGVKGNTATNATKPATVETGAEVNVPLFINEGDKIINFLHRLAALEINKISDVIIVDGGSHDKEYKLSDKRFKYHYEIY